MADLKHRIRHNHAILHICVMIQIEFTKHAKTCSSRIKDPLERAPDRTF